MPDEAPTAAPTPAPEVQTREPIPDSVAPPAYKPPSRPSFEDAIDELPDDGAVKPAPKPKVEEPKAEDQVPEGEVEEKTDEKAEIKKPDVTDVDEFSNLPAKELRRHLHNVKKELKASREELTKLRAKPTDEVDRVKLSETLKEREERLKAAEEKIKYYDYTASQEFVDKYKKPYDEAAASATQKATEISIKNADGTIKKVSREDFWQKIVMAPSEDDAIEAAHSLFGEDRLAQSKVSRLMSARDEVLTRYRDMENGKADFQKNVEARQRDLDAQRAQANVAAQQRIEAFNAANAEAEKKYPQWFAPKEGDEEINKALESGKRLSDSVFGEGRTKLPPEKVVPTLSAARMKVIGFDRLAVENSRMAKQIAELQKTIDGYKGSAPGNGSQKGVQKPRPSGHSLQSAFDAIDAMPDTR